MYVLLPQPVFFYIDIRLSPTQVPFRQYLCEQFLAAYNVYLEILHHVDMCVNVALHRDTPNWRLLNACPPCFYQLKEELSLPFRFLCEMDGNNSLKQTDASLRELHERHDPRTHRSDYWVMPEEVDVFQHEAKAQPQVMFTRLMHRYMLMCHVTG